MLEVRCSKLPLAVICARSLEPCATPIASDDAGARLGSAFHAVMAGRIKSGPVHDDVDLACAVWNVEANELAPLVGWGWRTWKEVFAEQFPSPIVEEELVETDFVAGTRIGTPLCDAAVCISGHPDVTAVVGAELRGLDYKTGREDTDSVDQFKGYSWLKMHRLPDVTQVRFTKLRVRDQRAETYVWTRSELDRWWTWAKDRLMDQSYRPGPGCKYCPRALSCEARTLNLRHGVQWMMAVDGLGAVEDEQLAELVATARGIEKLVKGILDTAKQEVQIRNRPIPGLNLVEQDQRQIDLARAWDVLCRRIGQDKVIELAGIGVGDTEKAIKALAPKGDKGPACERLFKELSDAGAISFKTVTKLECSYVSRSATEAIPGTSEN